MWNINMVSELMEGRISISQKQAFWHIFAWKLSNSSKLHHCTKSQGLPLNTPSVGVGSHSYRKSCCFGVSKSKETGPERPTRESSTTALKVAVKTGGLNYPHKEERSNELRYWRQRTEGEQPRKWRLYPRSALGSVEDYKKLWCDGKRQFKVQIGRLSQLGFWVTVGKCPQCCNRARASGHLYKHVFCIMKG